MSQIVEVDEHGAIQLPAELLLAVKPHTRFALEIQGVNLVLRRVEGQPFWATATPQERASRGAPLGGAGAPRSAATERCRR